MHERDDRFETVPGVPLVFRHGVVEDDQALHTLSWLQGYVPLQRLYWYREYGYSPENDVLTGPGIIDKTNVDDWITLVQSVIGADSFQRQIPW